MSDFIARLAARAVGQAAVAQPRLPSLFEAGPGSEVSPDGIEVIDDEVTTGPQSAVQSDTSAASAPSASRDAAPQRSEPASSREQHDTSDRPRTRQTATDAAGEAAPHQRQARPSLVPDPVPPTVLAVPAVPVMAASPLASWPATESIRSATPAAPELPAVRVHIGRLEIRANLPESAPPRPRTPPREDAAKGVSLADYLRGTR